MDNVIIDFQSAAAKRHKPLRDFKQAAGDDNIIDLSADPLPLMGQLNLSGKDGTRNWRLFTRLSERAGFTEIDFQRFIGASMSTVRQWSRGAGAPPLEKREHFRKVIIGAIENRRNNPPYPTVA